MNTRRVFKHSLALWLTSAVAIAQNIPSRERGLQAAAPYDYGQIDSVNLFNGNLTLSVPIGQGYKVDGLLSYALGLHYNSNVWEFMFHGSQIESFPVNQPPSSTVGGHTNAGTGWRLSLGEMVPPFFAPQNPSAEWIYVHPDGRRSRFYPTLHDTDPPSDYEYTRDGTYLRMGNWLYTTNTFEVHFPNGIVQQHDQGNGRLRRIEDPWNNYLDVTYPATRTIQLTDKHGRTHFIYRRASAPGKDMVDRVDLQAFGGARAIYTFNYLDVAVPRYKDTYYSCSPTCTVALKLLTSITLPDGSAFAMNYFTQEVQPHSGDGWTHEVPGMISSLTLPTRGKYEWRYADYAFDNSAGAPWGAVNEGVVSKKMIDENGVTLGEWAYAQVYSSGADQSTTTVRTPLGDKTVHYFYNEGDDWQHGLPFTIAVNDGSSPPRYLSRKEFDGTATSGSLQRTHYVRYTADDSLSPVHNTRLERTKTVYNSDSNREKGVTFSKFDGLGHYRKSVTSSTFPDTPVREEFIDYNATRGEYNFDANTGSGSISFTMLSDSDPWVLHTFPTRWSKENNVTATSKYCFDAGNGSVKRTRILKGAIDSNQDLLTQYTYASTGNVSRVESYGGDKETNNLSSSCSTTYSSSWSQYRTDQTYQYGSLRTSEYRTAAGASMSFKSTDLDIDLSTGLPTTSRDTAGLATSYSYDSVGRLTQSQPPGQVATAHTFYSADQFALARVKHLTGTDVESWNHFDAFGRPWKERVIRENGQFSAREVLYNENGWMASTSEWMNDGGALTSRTEYLSYDPFGRPAIVRPPDGSQHDVTFAHSGDYQVARSVRIGTGRSAGAVVYTTATTTERYNGHRQLARVIEPNGTETKYSYNVLARLAKVEMGIAGSPQVREFAYDLRGLPTSERHPEKGVSGNGLINFYDYDARGHATRANDGAHDLTFTFDRAERLTEIRETSGQRRPLKVLEYATANSGIDYRQGRLWKANRHNYLEPRLPGVAVTVTETYAYGAQGYVTGRTTALTSGETFTLNHAYDSLGALQTLTYPACTHATCVDDNPVAPRTVAMTYSRGYLTGVTGFASGISYNTNLTLGQVTHGNGEVVTHQIDPNNMRRRYRVNFNAAATQGLGPYAYDGAGNLAKVGTEDYLYDILARLTGGTLASGAWQTYTYDQFGNLTQVITNGTPQAIGVSASSNRLTGYQYDGAGNQLHYIQGSANLSLAYDAFNMINSIQGGTTDLINVYTAADERILSFPATGTTAKWTLRGLGNQLLRVFNVDLSGPTPVWSHDTDYIYQSGDALLASVSGATRYFYLDHLGTPRLIKDHLGSVLASHDYHAFGEEVVSGADQERKKFTGHERDFHGSGTDDDLDYMHARYFSPELGRFLRPDPADSFKLKAPQSWNRYAYVENNPLMFNDPTGREGAAAGLGEEPYDRDFGEQILAAWGSVYDGFMSMLAMVEQTLNYGGGTIGPVMSCTAECFGHYGVSVPTPFDTFKNVTGIGDIEAAAKLLNTLINAAVSPYNEQGISNAARAVDKHSRRPGSVFPELKGNQYQKNEAAGGIVRDILNNLAYRKPNNDGGWDYFGGSAGSGWSGGGVSFDENDNFIGLLEPQTTRPE